MSAGNGFRRAWLCVSGNDSAVVLLLGAGLLARWSGPVTARTEPPRGGVVHAGHAAGRRGPTAPCIASSKAGYARLPCRRSRGCPRPTTGWPSGKAKAPAAGEKGPTLPNDTREDAGAPRCRPHAGGPHDATAKKTPVIPAGRPVRRVRRARPNCQLPARPGRGRPPRRRRDSSRSTTRPGPSRRLRLSPLLESADRALACR